MNHLSNIVSFEDAKQASVSRRIVLRKLHPALKQLTFQHMTMVMQDMFDHADDTLLKMAESAMEGSYKTQYLDSIRILRSGRRSIEKVFFEKLESIFDAYQRETAVKETLAIYDYPGLISDADLEIYLAVENLIHKISREYGPDLAAIEKKLAYLHGPGNLHSGILPFNARSIVNTYTAATEMFGLELGVRLILLKLFDLHCIHKLSALYKAISRLFSDDMRLFEAQLDEFNMVINKQNKLEKDRCDDRGRLQQEMGELLRVNAWVKGSLYPH